MAQGHKGMGNHKHGVSGHAGKSPKQRMALKLSADRGEFDNKRKKPKPLEHDTVAGAFKQKDR